MLHELDQHHIVYNAFYSHHLVCRSPVHASDASSNHIAHGSKIEKSSSYRSYASATKRMRLKLPHNVCHVDPHHRILLRRIILLWCGLSIHSFVRPFLETSSCERARVSTRLASARFAGPRTLLLLLLLLVSATSRVCSVCMVCVVIARPLAARTTSGQTTTTTVHRHRSILRHRGAKGGNTTMAEARRQERASVHLQMHARSRHGSDPIRSRRHPQSMRHSTTVCCLVLGLSMHGSSQPDRGCPHRMIGKRRDTTRHATATATNLPSRLHSIRFEFTRTAPLHHTTPRAPHRQRRERNTA
jgi:hypothetical protein